MHGLLAYIYLHIRKKEVEKAKKKLRRLKTETVLQCITKECWRYGIQYEVILKTTEVLLIKLIGKKRSVLFKYHRAEIIFMEDFDKFSNLLYQSEAAKGVYITSGAFETKILHCVQPLFSSKKIVLQDNLAFIRTQLGIKGVTKDRFIFEKLKFFKYYPD